MREGKPRRGPGVKRRGGAETARVEQRDPAPDPLRGSSPPRGGGSFAAVGGEADGTREGRSWALGAAPARLGRERGRHWLTGEAGSISRATMSLIWSIVRTAFAPKRGIIEQGSATCGL